MKATRLDQITHGMRRLKARGKPSSRLQRCLRYSLGVTPVNFRNARLKLVWLEN